MNYGRAECVRIFICINTYVLVEYMQQCRSVECGKIMLEQLKKTYCICNNCYFQQIQRDVVTISTICCTFQFFSTKALLPFVHIILRFYQKISFFYGKNLTHAYEYGCVSVAGCVLKAFMCVLRLLRVQKRERLCMHIAFCHNRNYSKTHS